MYRRSCSSDRSSIRWPSLAVPSVSSDMICVCPRVKSAAQLGLELLPHRPLDRLEPQALEQDVQARVQLHLADDVLLGRIDRQLGAQLREDLVDSSGRLTEALLLDPLTDLRAVRRLELSG